MRYIGIIILLILCLTSLFFTCCTKDTVKPETASENLENTVIADTVETATEEPAKETLIVYPQQWATGDGTVENPWANNCIQKAYDFVPDGGTIFLKTGYYILSDTITTAKKIKIIGEGRNKSIIVLDIAHGNGIRIATDYCTLKGFTIDGDSQTDGEQYLSPIGIGYCDYALVEDIEVKNAGYYGINIYQVNHSLFQNIYAHDNYRHGLHPGSDTTGRNKNNIYRDIYAWNNGMDGFSDRGSSVDPDEQCYNIFDGLICWDNGRFGIEIDHQRGGVLSNSSASGNGKHGIYLLDIEDFNIHDCSTTLSGEEGLKIELSKNVNFTNVIMKNNKSGIAIQNCSNIALTTCQSYDDRVILIQRYGIDIKEGCSGITVLNCKLTPNKYGGIYNPTGVIITEKRE
jgi:hypothetical protein